MSKHLYGQTGRSPLAGGSASPFASSRARPSRPTDWSMLEPGAGAVETPQATRGRFAWIAAVLRPPLRVDPQLRPAASF